MSCYLLKDPDAVLDYQHDWSTWLGSDTISTSTWIASGLTVDSDSNTTTTATVWLSGGTPGQVITITNRVVTAGGRAADAELVIRIK